MLSQWIFLSLALLGVLWTVQRFRQRRISAFALFAWGALWLLLGVVAMKPELANRLADALGIGRGVDVVIYGAIIAMFALLFRVYVRLEQLDRDITKVTRTLALRYRDREDGDA